MNAPLRPPSRPPAARWHWQLFRQPLAGLDLQQDRCIDALLVWDLLTNFVRHGGAARGSHWRVMLEFSAPPAAVGLDAWCALRAADGEQGLLRDALAPSLARAPASTIHTALLPERLLPLLLAGVQQQVLRRFTMGMPCSAPPQWAETVAAPAWPCPPVTGLVHTLGLVDDGCCFAHADFRDAQGRGRVLALWDQETTLRAQGWWRHHTGPDGTPHYRYGAELSRPALDALLARHPGLGERAERTLYAELNRPRWGAPERRHGAGVMHLLAGRRRLPPADGDAAQLPVLFVQLPDATVADTAGHGLGFHVVDGVRWIVERSRALAADPNAWRSTIALSLGAIAGPHDGSSMAELALDHLAADARVSVVVAAGNCADDAVHAEASVQQDQPAVWWLRLPPDKHQDTFVQIWLPAGQPPERFQLLLQGPGLPSSPLLQLGQAGMLCTGDGLPVAGVVRAMKVAQGLHGHMVLVALAPSARRRDRPPRPLAPAGLWRIELQAAGQPAVQAHAWIERDDHVLGNRRPQQARFEPSQRPATAAGITPSHTLGTLANGLRTTVAAGHVARTARVSAAASQGPRRGGGREAAPLCYAPSDAGPSRPGVPVPGFFSGQRSRIGGTSAAAPQVARWLAEGRLTEAAARCLRPPLGASTPLPADARCIPPAECGDLTV